MHWSALALSVALLASLPVSVVVLALLFNRPSSARWLHRHGRLFGWVAAAGFGASSTGYWASPGEYPGLAFGFSLVGMVGMLVFVIAQSSTSKP